MTTNERILSSIKKHPGYSDYKIAKNLRRVSVQDVAYARLNLGRTTSDRDEPAKPALPKQAKPKAARTFASFQAANDVSHIIARKVSELLPANGEEYFTDHEFREVCGVAIGSWRRYADDDQFSAYRLKRGQHNYWAPKTMIPKMRMILGI